MHIWASHLKRASTLALLVIGLRLFALLATITILIIFIAGSLAHIIEPETFTSWYEGYWWASVTLTTVGYGDFVPHSLGGRILALFLMFGGIFLLSVLTATIVSLTVLSETQDMEKEIISEENEIIAELKELRKLVEQSLANQKVDQ